MRHNAWLRQITHELNPPDVVADWIWGTEGMRSLA